MLLLGADQLEVRVTRVKRWPGLAGGGAVLWAVARALEER